VWQHGKGPSHPPCPSRSAGVAPAPQGARLLCGWGRIGAPTRSYNRTQHCPPVQCHVTRTKGAAATGVPILWPKPTGRVQHEQRPHRRRRGVRVAAAAGKRDDEEGVGHAGGRGQESHEAAQGECERVRLLHPHFFPRDPRAQRVRVRVDFFPCCALSCEVGKETQTKKGGSTGLAESTVVR
jgi:hypothetical protein